MTFDDLVQIARETMLRDGEHAPLLYLEGTARDGIIGLEFMPESHSAKANMMRVIGLDFALKHPKNRIKTVSMVNEGWMLKVSPGEDYVMPSKSPNRIEVLVITRLTVANMKTRMANLRVVRDEQGKVMELVVPDEMEGAFQPRAFLLEAFVEGWRVAKQGNVQ